MAFRTNTVAAAGHDLDASACREGLACFGMKNRLGVTPAKPKPKRQACKGPKRAPRPSIDEKGRITKIIYPKAA